MGVLTEWFALRTMVQTPLQRYCQNPNRGSLSLNTLKSEHISKGWGINVLFKGSH